VKRTINTNSTVMRHLSLLYWGALGVMGAISLFAMPGSFTLGILAGGLLTIANFNVLRRTIQKAFSSGKMGNPKNGKKVALIGTYYIRIALMGIIIYCLLATGLVDPVGMAIGLSTVVVGIFVFGILMAFKPSSREAL